MQEQLLEKCVHENPVTDASPSPHHCFQYCKQQAGISLSFFLPICSFFSSLILLTHCISLVPPHFPSCSQ